jgi:hypothetical protein
VFNWTKTLFLVRGLPGEGKSTLARQLVGDKTPLICREKAHPQVVENDDYWMMPHDDIEYDAPGAPPTKITSYRYDYVPKMTHLAGWYCYAEAFRRLRLYDEVAVANTFVLRKYIFPYIEEARNLQVRVKIHRPSTPWVGSVDESFKRNIHAVPLDVITKMRGAWEELTQAEVDVLLGLPLS